MTRSFDQVLVDVHGTYRSRKIDHTPPDQFVDDSVSWPLLQLHLVKRVPLTVLMFVLLGFGLLVYVFGALLALGASYGRSITAPFEAVAWFGVLLMFLSFLAWVAWVVSLFFPLREPIAEYSLLIEGRSAAATAAYWWIWNTARQRQTPYRVQPAKLAGQYYLTIRQQRTEVVIVVREVGADLFVGWNMWRSRSTILVLLHLFRDQFANLGQGATYRASLRSADARALREAGHSLVREGIQAAIYGVNPGEDVLQRDLSVIPDVEHLLNGTMAPAIGTDTTTVLPLGQGGYGATGAVGQGQTSGTGYQAQTWPSNPPNQPS